jgi:rhodanese-related sulfurtransferase
MYSEISAQEFDELLRSQAPLELIDVREVHEWEKIRIPQAKLIPLSSFPFRVNEINFDRPVYLFCRTGSRSGRLCEWLEQRGYFAINIHGSLADLYKIQSQYLETTPLFTPDYF